MGAAPPRRARRPAGRPAVPVSGGAQPEPQPSALDQSPARLVGPPERLSPEPSLNPQRGYADAWPFEGGVLLQWATYGNGGGQEVSHPDGTLEELGWDLPNRPGADHVVEVGPDRVVVLNLGGTGPGTTGALVAVTPSTGEVRVLVPGNPEEGGVLSVIVPGNPGIGARAPA